jgi:hypothetical protein
MADIDKIGLVNIIDECFDKYNGRYTPYNVEENSSILSFLKNIYGLIKDESVFENLELLSIYKETVEKILKKINQLENRKIYQYKFLIGNNGSSLKKEKFISFLTKMWNYCNRNFSKTLTENERKIGYYETVNGETFFNGYRENVIIGGKLTPSYENNEVNYTTENNPYCIKMIGITNTNKKEKPYIVLCLNGTEISFESSDPLIDLIEYINDESRFGDTVFGKFYNSNDPEEYRIYFAFSNGFIVNDMNEYENPNGRIYEIFEALFKTLNRTNKENYFKDYLKDYFYTGIVERYREKKIDDRETNLISKDLNFGRFDNIIPGVYETLSGKGGNIGGIQTIDFDRKEVLGLGEYSRLMFDASYYNPETNNIEIYINKKYLSGSLKKISEYKNIEDYINSLNNKYSIFSSYDGFNLNNVDYLKQDKEIKNILLKENLFAIEPNFWPENDNTDEYRDDDFFSNNIKQLQKVYFYDDNSYLAEDELLKQLSFVEHSKQVSLFERGLITENEIEEQQFVRSQRNRNIDIGSDEDNLIIYLTVKEKLNVSEKKYLGKGYINLKKLPQKFKDNKISKLVDNEDTNKTSYFESEEFSSVLDDREITVVHTTNMRVANTIDGGLSPAFNEEYLDCVKTGNKVSFERKEVPEGIYQKLEFPNFKKAVLNSNGEYIELECTEFAKKVDLGSIKQIRVMSTVNNKERFLFNVRSIKKQYKTYKSGDIYFDDYTNLNDLGLTYIANNAIKISKSSLNTYNISNKYIKISNTKYEEFKNSSSKIDIKWNNDLKKINYVIDVETNDRQPNNTAMIFSEPEKHLKQTQQINSNEYVLDLSGMVLKESESFVFEYKLILEKNEYIKTEKLTEFKNLEVYILDYIQMTGRPPRKEFLGSTYDNNGNIDIEDFVPEKEKLFFISQGFKLKLKPYIQNTRIFFEYINTLNCFLQNTIIKATLKNIKNYRLLTILKLKKEYFNVYVKLLKNASSNAKSYLKEHKFVVKKSTLGLDEPLDVIYKKESKVTIESRKKRNTRIFARNILLSTETEDGYAIKFNNNFITEDDLENGLESNLKFEKFLFFRLYKTNNNGEIIVFYPDEYEKSLNIETRKDKTFEFESKINLKEVVGTLHNIKSEEPDEIIERKNRIKRDLEDINDLTLNISNSIGDKKEPNITTNEKGENFLNW